MSNKATTTAVESAHAAIIDSAEVYRVDGRHTEAYALERAAAFVEAAIPEARRLEADLAEARAEVERLRAEKARRCQCERCQPRVLLSHEPCGWCGANGDGCPVLHRCPHGERCAAHSEGDFPAGPWRLVCDQCEAGRDFELGFERLAKAKADREVMLAALEGGALAPAELFARPEVAALADPDLTLRQLMEVGAVVQDGEFRLVAVEGSEP